MAHTTMTPFGNDAESLAIGDLAIENGTNRIALHGSLDLTRDRAGLARARVLKRTLDAIVRALEGMDDLPETVSAPIPPVTTKNPFA